MIDFVGINNAALARGRTFLEALIPGGKFRSLEYQVRNPTRDDKRLGSFSINYRTHIWKDFATGDGGGDVISLWAYVRGIRQCDAARELADKLGVSANKPRWHLGGHAESRSFIQQECRAGIVFMGR